MSKQQTYTIKVYRQGDDVPLDQRTVTGLKHAKAEYRRILQGAIRMGCYVSLTDEQGKQV